MNLLPKGRTARRAAWASWLVTMTIVIAGTVFLVLSLSVQIPPTGAFRGWAGLLAVSAGTVGAIVAYRRPGNAIGWLFCVLGLVGALEHFTANYAYAGLLSDRSLPAATVAAWMFQWLGIVDFTALTLLLLLFPTGSPVSRRWRPFVWLAVVGCVGALVDSAFRPGPMSEFASISNPFAVHGAFGEVIKVFSAFLALASLAIIGALVSVAVRFRRARGIERLQLKWLVSTATVILVGFLGFVVSSVVAYGADAFSAPIDTPASQAFVTLVFAGFVILPIAVGLAVLRYQLYEIDRVISRTLTYALVSALLAGSYAIITLLPTAVLRTDHVPSGLIAAATIVVAAMFRPALRRVQNAVDHRFNRSRYDAARTIEEFSSRLRDEVDLDTLRCELEILVNRTMQPSHVRLWLKDSS